MALFGHEAEGSAIDARGSIRRVADDHARVIDQRLEQRARREAFALRQQRGDAGVVGGEPGAVLQQQAPAARPRAHAELALLSYLLDPGRDLDADIVNDVDAPGERDAAAPRGALVEGLIDRQERALHAGRASSSMA